jgi:membrane protein required for beta-lactamase induction
MFCPKCGVNNLDEQRYCRGCGHGLASHRLAMEGKVEDAGTHIKSGSLLVSIGLVIVGIVKLNLLANLIFSPTKWSVIFNLLLLLIVAVPLMVAGILRLNRAKHALSPPHQADDEAIAESEAARLAAAPTTDHLIDMPSVTEHTTLELKEPEPRR